MHYLPDTEDEDSAAETFWPEGYKQVIREQMPPKVSAQLRTDRDFEAIYQEGFSNQYADLDGFLDRIGNMVAIGAENGADDAFDNIMDSFLNELPLPDPRRYAHYLMPEALPDDTAGQLRQSVVDEYTDENIYANAYRVGYADTFASVEDYIDRVSDIVVTGTENGANDTLARIYRSFLIRAPLTPARRKPRRLKTW